MKRRTLLLSPLPFVLSSLVNAKPIEKTETAEIVIIGAGAAGLFAAVAAKENGAGRVVLIEKNPSPFFSSTSYSAGSVNASGTLAQLKHGIQDIDGKEEFTEEILRQGNYENDKALVANYVKNAAPALDWLTEKGVELTPSTNIAFRVKRMHGCDLATGARYVEVLFSEAIRLGVEIWFNTKAIELITEKGNEVLGVQYKRGRSYGNLLAQKGVILCTGGFAGDVNRVDRDIPKFAGTADICLSLEQRRRAGYGNSHRRCDTPVGLYGRLRIRLSAGRRDEERIDFPRACHEPIRFDYFE